MGIIWSRFKKKESTKDKLQKIQNEILSLEEYKEHTEQRRKKLVGSFIAYSIFFYLIAAIIWYFYYLPPTLSEKLLYATPFIGIIILIYVIKQLLSCYYRWKVRRNENKLSALKEKKSEMLEQVMDTETYKVAKEILEIYAPEQIRKTSMTIKSPLVTPISSSSQRMAISQNSGDVRRRIISPQTSQSYSQRQIHAPVRPANLPTPLPFTRPAVSPRPQQIRPNLSSTSSLQSSRIRYSSVTPMNPLQFSRTEGATVNPSTGSSVADAPGPPMPRPILPRERGILDRFVEYLVGDGPSNRYALVCKQCESHNGMALKEEFPYIAFRCAYCFYWNPARKQKPAPPRLETVQLKPNIDLSRKLFEKEEEEEEEGFSSGEEEETESDVTSSSSLSSENLVPKESDSLQSDSSSESEEEKGKEKESKDVLASGSTFDTNIKNAEMESGEEKEIKRSSDEEKDEVKSSTAVTQDEARPQLPTEGEN